MHGTFIQDDHGNISNRIQQVSHQLTSCKTIPEIKQIRDTAEQLRVDAQQRDLGLKLQNRATELKIQAERKLGKSLAEMKLRGGDRKTGRETIRLKDLGIDKNQSARWQQSASVPESKFRAYVQQTQTAGKELSSAGMLRLAKQCRIEQSSMACESNSRNNLSASSSSPPISMPLRPPQHLPSRDFSDLIDEGKNHVNTLTGLLEQLCERAGFAADTGESRACRRYLQEISLHFDYLMVEMQQLAKERRFLTSGIPSNF